MPGSELRGFNLKRNRKKRWVALYGTFNPEFGPQGVRLTKQVMNSHYRITGMLLFTKTPPPKKKHPQKSHAQVQISPLEMMSAVRNWLRTIEIFMGCLRHLEQVQERTPQKRNPPGTEELSIDKALRQELMKIAQGTQPLIWQMPERKSNKKPSSEEY